MDHYTEHPPAVTSITALWVPVVALAHIWCGFWLSRAIRLIFPNLSLKSVLFCFFHGGEPEAEAEEPRQEDDEPALVCAEVAPVGGLRGRLAANAEAKHADKSRARVSTSLVEVERQDLRWEAISCHYSTNAGKKWVLKNIYGGARPGEMHALMGPSGAGKSTLMDILAHRKSTGVLGGRVLVNGKPAGSEFIRRTAYVPQDDNFWPVLTALEVLQFYAGIILPSSWSGERRATRIDEVVDAMGLRHAVKTLVGGVMPSGRRQRGLSGGERKRLSIATGILAAPSIVFLDEPTTGLDAFAALTVMGYMKRMSEEHGHTVVTCIHQPRAAIWSMFDSVSLLSCGRLMYTGICDGLVEWFRGVGFDYDATRHGVVSDWALDLVACGSHKPRSYCGGVTITSRAEVRTLSAHFVAAHLSNGGGGGGGHGGGGGGFGGDGRHRTLLALGGSGGSSFSSGVGGGSLLSSPLSPIRQQQHLTQEELQQSRLALAGCHPPQHRLAAAAAELRKSWGGLRRRSSAVAKDERAALLAPSSWWQQFWYTLKRELLVITRYPAEVGGRTLTNCWVSATMGLLYFALPDDSSSLRPKVNMLLNMLAFFCLMPYVSMSIYYASKSTYLADVTAKLYSPSAYYVAKVLATLPFQLMSSGTFTFVLYGMAGLRHSTGAILMTTSITTITSLIAVQVLHCCAVLAPTQDVAFMYSIAWTAVQLLFNNFFITFKEVSLQWLTSLKYLSAVYYAFEGMAVVQFAGLEVPCRDGLDNGGATFLRELLPNTKLLRLAVVQKALRDPGPDCVADAAAVLEYFNFSRDYRTTIAILGGYLLACHVLTYCSLVLVARRERR